MTETSKKCKDCIWYNELRHNEGTNRGYRKSHCCTLMFEVRGNLPIIQVKPSDEACNDFFDVTIARHDNGSTVLRQEEKIPVQHCDSCKFLRTEVNDGQRHYYCKRTEDMVYPYTDYCSFGRK